MANVRNAYDYLGAVQREINHVEATAGTYTVLAAPTGGRTLNLDYLVFQNRAGAVSNVTILQDAVTLIGPLELADNQIVTLVDRKAGRELQLTAGTALRITTTGAGPFTLFGHAIEA